MVCGVYSSFALGLSRLFCIGQEIGRGEGGPFMMMPSPSFPSFSSFTSPTPTQTVAKRDMTQNPRQMLGGNTTHHFTSNLTLTMPPPPTHLRWGPRKAQDPTLRHLPYRSPRLPLQRGWGWGARQEERYFPFRETYASRLLLYQGIFHPPLFHTHTHTHTHTHMPSALSRNTVY